MHVKLSGLILVMSSLCLLLTAMQVADLSDPTCIESSWGPYDAKPGHPTLAEKNQFLSKVKPLAIEAETRFRVPAAAIAAMAILESGFGFTRVALNARNLFGFKVPSGGSPGKRGRYTLVCQPNSDAGKEYIVFSDYTDSMMYVASRLNTAQRYAPITAGYAAIPPVSRTRQDIVNWVYRIASAGYNCCPQQYRYQVSRIMNDPLRPNDMPSQANLFSLSLTSGDRQ